VIDAFLYFLALIASIALIAGAGNLFVNSACSIARGLGIPRAVIGLTLVSLATTVPEFITSTTAAGLGNVEIAYGNAVGTCIFNAAAIVGIAALIIAIPVAKHQLHEGWVMLGFGALVTLLALDGGLSRVEGLLLLLIMVAFLALITRRESKNRVSNKIKPSGESLRRPAALFLLGAVGIVIGSRLLIYAGVGIATLIGVSEAAIGFTIVAIGTSIPELTTAIISAAKKVPELSLGNIIGANILDLSWVLGMAAVINPLPADAQTTHLSNPIMLLIMGVILSAMVVRRKLTRKHGVLLLGIYVAYIVGMFAFWY
jgi:cation:H+ antiporter